MDCTEAVGEIVGLGEGEVFGEVVVEESVVVGGGEEAVGLRGRAKGRENQGELRRFAFDLLGGKERAHHEVCELSLNDRFPRHSFCLLPITQVLIQI